MPTIEIRGINELKAILAGIEPAITAAIKSIAVEIKGVISKYPPAVVNSRYRRTGTLGRRWTVQSSKFAARIGNDTSYGPFVQDRNRQAWMHQGRWQTTQDVTEEYEPKVEKMLEDNVQKVLNK